MVESTFRRTTSSTAERAPPPRPPTKPQPRGFTADRRSPVEGSLRSPSQDSGASPWSSVAGGEAGGCRRRGASRCRSLRSSLRSVRRPPSPLRETGSPVLPLVSLAGITAARLIVITANSFIDGVERRPLPGSHRRHGSSRPYRLAVITMSPTRPPRNPASRLPSLGLGDPPAAPAGHLDLPRARVHVRFAPAHRSAPPQSSSERFERDVTPVPR